MIVVCDGVVCDPFDMWKLLDCIDGVFGRHHFFLPFFALLAVRNEFEGVPVDKRCVRLSCCLLLHEVFLVRRVLFTFF